MPSSSDARSGWISLAGAAPILALLIWWVTAAGGYAPTVWMPSAVALAALLALLIAGRRVQSPHGQRPWRSPPSPLTPSGPSPPWPWPTRRGRRWRAASARRCTRWPSRSAWSCRGRRGGAHGRRGVRHGGDGRRHGSPCCAPPRPTAQRTSSSPPGCRRRWATSGALADDSRRVGRRARRSEGVHATRVASGSSRSAPGCHLTGS